MTFSVNLNALRGLPRFLDRRADELSRAGSYVRDHTTLNYGTGLADVTGRHERNVTLIGLYLSVASRQYAQADSDRLSEAITRYSAADARTAARYDASLPMPVVTSMAAPLISQLGPEVFDDRASPPLFLITPADHYADMPYRPSWWDTLSPTSMMRDLIWKLTSMAARLGLLSRPYDPFELFVNPYVGDWAGLLRCAEVFDHVADLLSSEGAEIGYAAVQVSQVWQGHAAGLCAANLGDFKGRLDDGPPPLRSLASAYRDVAAGVHDNAELLATALTALFDCASETLIELGTFGLFTAYEIGSALNTFVRLFRAALRLADKVQDIVGAGFNVSDEAMHRLGVLTTLVTMPVVHGPQPALPTGP